MAVVGIDLGTTYSVIATPKHFEGEQFQNVRGVTIIKDKNKLRLTPSVVGVDRQGEVIVGHRAKNLAGRPGSEPIMWVKRSMGEARQFELGQKHLQPENVSAEILRYLKEMAEAQMQEPIEEAVIAVPAWFTLGQKQKTKEAGELAGLKVSEILQEPVAAALMYCYDDEHDPLTIMTYDLGGGTFDIAVLRKSSGHFDILAFDGNRNLGGYDFDKRLATWMIEQLQKQGYQIDSGPHSPAWYKFLMIAETVKQKLSENESYLLAEMDTGVQDLQGDPIVIGEMKITRQEFEDLIQDYIEETIRLCNQAIKRAGINVQDLNEIVMVGGSSRIPIVAERLQAEFGLKPKLVEPDLCVAIGAAILAQRLPKRIGVLKVNPIPETTSLSSFQVSGKLEETEELPDVSECQVELVQIGGTFQQKQRLNKQGGYVFQLVPLVTDQLSTYSLRALDGAGRELAEYRFSIRQQAGNPPKKGITWLQSNVLSKPISIMTVTGLYTIAESGKALPWECSVSARTTDQTGIVHIPVYEDTYQIGEIVVDDLPTDLETGTKVEITLNIKEDFSIVGKAKVRNKEGQAKIQIPATVIKGPTELEAELQQVREQAEQALTQGDRGQVFRVRPEIKRNLDTCQRILYDEKDPNLSNVQELLDKTRTLIRGLFGWQPDPSVEQFDEIRREIDDDLLPELYKYRPAASSDGTLEGELKAIVLLSEKALKEKNDLGWADSFDHIRRLRNRISADLENEARKRRGSNEKEPPPDPHAIKLKLAMDLVGMRKEAERRGLLNQLEKEFQACDQALKTIEPGLPNGMARLVEYYQTLHEPLYAKVTGTVERKDPKRGWVEVFS